MSDTHENTDAAIVAADEAYAVYSAALAVSGLALEAAQAAHEDAKAKANAVYFATFDAHADAMYSDASDA